MSSVIPYSIARGTRAVRFAEAPPVRRRELIWVSPRSCMKARSPRHASSISLGGLASCADAALGIAAIAPASSQARRLSSAFVDMARPKSEASPGARREDQLGVWWVIAQLLAIRTRVFL